MAFEVVGGIWVCLAFWFVVSCTADPVFPQPEQIHLSYGADATQMVVTWVTQSPPKYMPVVEYGLTDVLPMVAKGNYTIYKDGGSEHRILYIHRVTLTDLMPMAKYYYHCGSPDGWSSIYFFTTMKYGTNWSPRFAIYGDMGNSNAQSLGRLQQEVQQGMYDTIFHVGDFAYNMDSDNARVGDEFMNQIESIAAYVPYMTCVGNHESAYNFSNYVNRFTMPGGDNHSLFFSFNVGPVHVISISTEFYFYVQYGWLQIVNQYRWLEKDLIEANKPENRAKHPWIITMGHRPMYCSNNDHDDCTKYESIIRTGIPDIHSFGLEDLFYKYGVDVMLWAHEHSYERLWPVYNKMVCNGSDPEFPYTNPRAPVHIITGSAGCSEDHDPFQPDYRPWSAFRSVDYGYTRMTVYNSTHLYAEQISDDQGGLIIDKMLLIKEKHGAGTYSCH